MIKHTENRSGMKEGKYTERDEQVVQWWDFIQHKTIQKHTICCFGWDRPENSQGHILFPGAVLAHAYAKARTEKQLSRGHQVALLRGFNSSTAESQMKGMQLAVGAGGREEDGGLRSNNTVRNNTLMAPDPHPPSCATCVTRNLDCHLIGKWNPMPDEWRFVSHWIPSMTFLLKTWKRCSLAHC